MLAILAALLPVIQTAMTGTTIATALAGISIWQWAKIGIEVAQAEPALLKALKALHPAIRDFLGDIENGIGAELAALGIHSTLAAIVAANADKAIQLQPGAAGQ
jgi:hypothetical protein